MSLRSRLVAGFMLVALVLLGTDIAVALLVHRSLISSVDQRLDVAQGGPNRFDRTSPGDLGLAFGISGSSGAAGTSGTAAASGAATSGPAASGSAASGVSGASGASAASGVAGASGTDGERDSVTDLYFMVINQQGVVIRSSTPLKGAHAPDQPAIPKDVARLASAVGAVPRPFTVHSSDGGGVGFRAVAFQTPNGDTLFVAASLRDTNSTFRRVVGVEGLATLAVFAALALVAWFVLHLGVRPLDQMAETADAIAAGDLSRRVERAESRTEAGRLGVALNTMLGEIEHAFDERTASEARLRRFVADASHELRTPLTSIRGYAELWRQGGLSDEADLADAMRRMEREAARMGVLVDEMLLLARLDQGRPLESMPVDLARITADAVADARAVEPERPISLIGPDHLIVQGDDMRLHQVVSNLFANTRLHTPAPTAVRARIGSDDGVAFLEVEDDGPGLGPEPNRVFERFYRADPARARASGGSGLGLSIVAAVSEAHGGRAVASSSPSGGALIRVEIPLVSKGGEGRTDAVTAGQKPAEQFA